MKHSHLIIFTALILTASLFCKPLFALEITFKSKTEVTTDYITLGDLVSFDENSALTSSLSSKVIGRSPDPGKRLSLDSILVRDSIMRKSSLSRNTLWTGSRVVKVFRPGQKISSKQLVNAIDKYLKAQRHKLPKAKIEFQPRSLPLPFMIQKGALDIEVIPSHPSIIKSSRFSLIIRVDGKVRKNLSIQGKLKAMAPVVIVTESLQRGSILTQGNTKTIVKDLTEYDAPHTDQRQILGKRLKRTLRANRVINAEDVEIPPMIRRGQVVKIIFYQGSLYLTATGIARSDGKLNQIIRVRNESSNKLIRGKVTAPGIVEVMI